jgi:hypothetical protein
MQRYSGESSIMDEDKGNIYLLEQTTGSMEAGEGFQRNGLNFDVRLGGEHTGRIAELVRFSRKTNSALQQSCA